jgi:hypothetical protein
MTYEEPLLKKNLWIWLVEIDGVSSRYTGSSVSGWVIGWYWGSIPGKGSILFSHHSVHIYWLWGPSSSLSCLYPGYFSWRNAAGARVWPLTSMYCRRLECVTLQACVLSRPYVLVAWFVIEHSDNFNLRIKFKLSNVQACSCRHPTTPISKFKSNPLCCFGDDAFMQLDGGNFRAFAFNTLRKYRLTL